MLKIQGNPIKPLLAAILFVSSMFSYSLFIVMAGLLGKIIPFQKVQTLCDRTMVIFGEAWVDFCAVILRLTTPVQWDIQGFETIDPKKSYLIIANHQSYIDIPVLYHAIKRKVPLSRYFMKKQLQYVPVWGWACKMLDFPCMYRYSKEVLAKYPELKGKDIEETRRACKKLRGIPFSLVNFSEGTRFTQGKRIDKKSAYKHLLPPRAGGIGYSLAVVGDVLDSILNVTIVYVGGEISAWNFFTGKIKKVVVQVEVVPVSSEFLGDYENDADFRQRMQTWVNEVWKKKDHLIEEVLSSSATKCLQ